MDKYRIYYQTGQIYEYDYETKAYYFLTTFYAIGATGIDSEDEIVVKIKASENGREG